MRPSVSIPTIREMWALQSLNLSEAGSLRASSTSLSMGRSSFGLLLRLTSIALRRCIRWRMYFGSWREVNAVQAADAVDPCAGVALARNDVTRSSVQFSARNWRQKRTYPRSVVGAHDSTTALTTCVVRSPLGTRPSTIWRAASSTSSGSSTRAAGAAATILRCATPALSALPCAFRVRSVPAGLGSSVAGETRTASPVAAGLARRLHPSRI